MDHRRIAPRTSFALGAGTLAVVLLGASRWTGDAHAQSDSDFDRLQITFAPSGVTFFDERTGDVWIHPYQVTGAIGVAHFRVSERGAKLTPVEAKK